MAFDPAPKGFFGNGYALSSSEIKLPTSDFADITIGTFTVDGTTSTVTTSVAHNLKVGDKVAISSGTTLPAPFTAADHYVISVPLSTTVTLALTRNGTAIVSTDTGTGTHTIKALAPLQEVTDVEGHATTGDYRAVIHGLMELLFNKYNNTPTADRPTGVTVAKSTSPNVSTGIDTQYYTVTVKTISSGSEVVAE
jgi:hypothetical protein